MEQRKHRQKLYNYFSEYVKQRIKEEKDNASSLEKYAMICISTQQDVEDRL